MAKLYIASVRTTDGLAKPLITVRASGEGEAKLFLEATYPDDVIESVVEPSDWVSDADTGSEPGDVREHPDAVWQAPSSLSD
jgi:hypothetical protein